MYCTSKILIFFLNTELVSDSQFHKQFKAKKQLPLSSRFAMVLVNGYVTESIYF